MYPSQHLTSIPNGKIERKRRIEKTSRLVRHLSQPFKNEDEVRKMSRESDKVHHTAYLKADMNAACQEQASKMNVACHIHHQKG